MTRVHHQRPQLGAQHSSVLEQPRAALRTKKKKNKFKIVLEAVTQEKKKLHSILSYAANAPPDFGFIPVGYPELTEWCKEQCRQRRLDVHVVSAKPKNNIRLDPAKLSHHVHRIGHHFPLEIIELGCKRFDYAYDGVGGLRKVDPGEDAKWYTQRVEDYSSRQALQGKPVDETLDYIRGAVRELFPKIPEADLTSIVTHAFAKGTERVGNAKDIPLARRIQLAVGAHIRHTRTDYDKLLKTVGYLDARRIVEPDSLAKLLEWRDEAGGDSHELEETFREVIIIDDEDMSSDEDDSIDTPDERDQSMEIVSSRATAQELQPDRHSVYPRIDNRDASRASGRIIVVGPYAPPPRAAARPAPANLEIAAQEPYTQHRQAYPPSSRAAAHPAPAKREITAQEPYVQHRQAPAPRLFRSTTPVPRTANAPLLRKIDGQMYELQPITGPAEPPRVRSTREYDRPDLIAPPRGTTQGWIQNTYLRTPPSVAPKDVVLPSVEAEIIDLTSPRRAGDTQRPLQSVSEISGVFNASVPKRKARSPTGELDMTQGELNMKRPRPVSRWDIEPARPVSNQGGLPALPREYMDSRGRSQVHTFPSPSELTYSQQRPSISGDRGAYLHNRSYPVHDPSVGYANVSSPQAQRREMRGSYYETYAGTSSRAGESSRAYISDYEMYERRPLPPGEYSSATGPRKQVRAVDDGARHLRNGVQYGSW